MNSYRHGDLIIEETCESLRGKAVIRPGPRGHILAEGEATGHAHRIEESTRARLYRTGVPGNDNGERWLRVLAPVALRHEEHGEIVLPRGRYRVRIKRQYLPDGWTRVVD